MKTGAHRLRISEGAKGRLTIRIEPGPDHFSPLSPAVSGLALPWHRVAAAQLWIAMHELALMESVVAAVVERVGVAPVAVVRMEVGRLAAVVPGTLQFCFEVCARGTCLEGASLEISIIPGRARCRDCGVERAIESYSDFCDCGATDSTVLSGEELRVKNVEVA